jgi:hypothetical protein
MWIIYRVHEGNPRLQYYTNTLDYYSLNNHHLVKSHQSKYVHDFAAFPLYFYRVTSDGLCGPWC